MRANVGSVGDFSYATKLVDPGTAAAPGTGIVSSRAHLASY